MIETDHPWPALPLRQLASEMCLGKMLDKQKNRGSLRPYLRNINVRWFSFDLDDLKEMRFEADEEVRFGLQPGDLVICEGGEPGRAAVWKGQADDARIQKALHRVRFNPDEYDPSFAMYFLYFGTSTDRFAKYYTGTTIKHLTGKALSQVPFPVPPLNEQRRIVETIEELLSDLDAGVAALERARANLKRYRASVLAAAVSGRLTADWRAEHPDVEPASALLQRILAERRRRWEADQLAKFAAQGKQPPKGWQAKYVHPAPPDTAHLTDLPAGWTVASLEQLTSGARPICYGILMPKENVANGVLYVKVRDMKGDKIDLSSLHRTKPEIAMEYARASLTAGDLLLAIRGTYGRIAHVPPELEGGNITQDTARLAVAPEMSAAFVAWMLRSTICQNFFKRVARGVAVKGVNIGDVRRSPVLVPPIGEQDLIATEVAEKLSQIEAAATAIDHGLRRAARLRQSILKQAFAGRLVPQDPNDEPVATLLERITASRSAGRSNSKSADGKKPRGKSGRKAILKK